jgi:hypothetical protein
MNKIKYCWIKMLLLKKNVYITNQSLNTDINHDRSNTEVKKKKIFSDVSLVDI